MFSEFKQAFRSLLRSPGFTAAVVLTLALSIGAGAALVSVLQGVLRPWQDPYPQSLYSIRLSLGAGETSANGVSQHIERLRAAADIFDGVTVSFSLNSPVRTGAGQTQLVHTGHVMSNFLRLTGTRVLHGRDFAAGEDSAGGPATVMVSEPFWRTHLGGDAAAIGRILQVDGAPREIIAVMPRLPAPFQSNDLLVPDANIPYGAGIVLASLRPGVSPARANAQIAALVPYNPGALQKSLHPAATAYELHPVRLRTHSSVEKTLWMMAGAMAAVFLITCANVAYLFVVRAMQQHRSLAIRLALGARRRDIVRISLAESLPLCAAAAILAMPIAAAVLQGVIGLAGSHLPSPEEISIEPLTALFCALAAALPAALITLVPVCAVPHVGSRAMFADGRQPAMQPPAGRLFRDALVVFQVQLSLVLVTCAGLLAISFHGLTRIDPGIAIEGAAFGAVAAPETGVGEKRALAQRLEAQLNAAPEFAAAGLTSAGLTSGGQPRLYAAADEPFPSGAAMFANDDTRRNVMTRTVTAGYFPALGIRLKEGRLFGRQDGAQTQKVVVINESLARKISVRVPVIDQMLRIGIGGGNAAYRVIGVVRDVRTADLTQPAGEEAYLLHAQSVEVFLGRAVARARAGLPAEAAALALQRVFARVDPDLPMVVPAQTVEELLGDSIGVQRLAATLIGCFALLALLLAALGLYGVLAYTVVQRTPEIGVRIALGARANQVVSLVLGQGLRLMAAGLVIGVAVTLGTVRFIRAFLHEVDPLDPVLLGSFTLLFALIAALACLVPSLRASRIDPTVALRAV